MLSPRDRDRFRKEAATLLDRAGIVVAPAELAAFELADLSLGHFEVEGLGVLVYINTDRYCAKELVMLPGQTCPEHRHPPVGPDPGKQETFRVRSGLVYLHVEGPATARPAAKPPSGKERFYTAAREIVLHPGEQFTIPPNTLHWFQAGAQGAVISEFSSTSRDELDIFTDPGVRRVQPR